MKSRPTFASAMLVLICLAGCGGSSRNNNPPNTPAGPTPTATTPAPEFLFASLPASNSIAGFQIDRQTGALAQVSGSPFPTTGKTPMGMAALPSGKFLYAVNFQSQGIAAYSIAANGALSAVGGEITGGMGIEPFQVVIDPSGSFAYTAASLSAVPAGYVIDGNTGMLTPMSTAQADFQDLFGAGGLVVTNSFVYESFVGGVDAFPIGANGKLTDTTSSPALLTGGGLGKMALGPGGKFLYAIGTGSEIRPEPPIPGTLVTIAIGSAGALAVVGTPLPFPNGSDVTVSGNFLFALNQQGVSAFAIDPNTGALTSVSGSPFVLSNGSGFLRVDASGKFLYVATLNSFSQAAVTSSIAAFSIDSSGALHPVAGSPFALPDAVGGLAVAQQ